MSRSTPLADIIDLVCETRQVQSTQGRLYYAQAVRAFDERLGRVAKLADLSIEAFKPLKARHRRYLVLIWAEAYRRGIADTRPADSDRHGFQFFRMIEAPSGAGRTLADFVDGHTESNLSIQTVNRLSFALGRPATVGDLNTEIIKTFIAAVCDANPNLKAGGVREREGLRSIWWAAYRAGLAESPERRTTPWDCLPEIMKKAPPIVLDKLPEESKTLTLTDFLEHHYYPCRPGLSPKTKKEYGNSVRKLERYLDRPSMVGDLNNQLIGSYIAALSQAGQSKGSIAKERAQLLAFWRHAHNDGLLIVGPLIQSIKTPEVVPTALTLDQLKQLRRTTAQIKGKLGGVDWSLLMRACVSIQYTTGARLGAALGLTFDDIKKGVVTLRAETRKFGKEPIVKKLPEWVLPDIEAIKPPKRSLLFTDESTIENFACKFDRLFFLAGVPRPKGKSSHLLRSTHATMIWLAGGDATASLGHSSEETTANSYLDRRFKPDESFNFLPNLGGNNE